MDTIYKYLNDMYIIEINIKNIVQICQLLMLFSLTQISQIIIYDVITYYQGFHLEVLNWKCDTAVLKSH
jgi:hypothetical protein